MTGKEPLACFAVGTTKSGKTVFCCCQHRDIEVLFETKYLNFSFDDFFDAYCIFQFLLARSLRKSGGNSDESFLFISVARTILEKQGLSEKLDWLKQRHGVSTILDVCKYGSKLVVNEFKGL